MTHEGTQIVFTKSMGVDIEITLRGVRVELKHFLYDLYELEINVWACWSRSRIKMRVKVNVELCGSGYACR